MKNTENDFLKRLFIVVSEDAMSAATSAILWGIPIPVSTIHVIMRQIIHNVNQHNEVLNYVDWELRGWEDTYRKELQNVVTLEYKEWIIKIPQVYLLNNVIENASLENFILKRIDGNFSLTPEIKGITEKAYNNLKASYEAKQKKNNRAYYNSPNLRLAGYKKENGKHYLTLQTVYYDDFVHTNLVLDAKDTQGRSLRDFIHHDGSLEAVEESKLGNNFGINILIFTAEGNLIIQKRSEDVAFRKGEYCPSASGTFEEIDLSEKEYEYNANNLKQYITREFREEVGIHSDHVTELKILGITRELIRGGEPEMFAFAKIDLTQNEVIQLSKKAQDRYEVGMLVFHPFDLRLLNKEHFNSHDVRCWGIQIDKFLDIYGYKSSVPLTTAIALLQQYILNEKR